MPVGPPLSSIDQQPNAVAASPAASPATPQQGPQFNAAESAGMGAVNGATLGAQNKIAGAVNAGAGEAGKAINEVGGSKIAAFLAKHPDLAKIASNVAGPVSPLLAKLSQMGTQNSGNTAGQMYTQGRDASAANFNAAKAQHPIAYTGGQVAGAVAPAMAGGAAIDAGVGLGKAALGAGDAAEGAEEAASPIESAISKYIKKPIGTGVKAATNAGLQGAASGALAQDGGTAGDKLRAAENGGLAAANAVNPLKPGMNLEERLGMIGADEIPGVSKVWPVAAGAGGATIGSNVGADSSDTSEDDESDVEPSTEPQATQQSRDSADVHANHGLSSDQVTAILKQLGTAPNTPDGAQKASALELTDFQNPYSDDAPGKPVSSNVPNVITEPDGTKSLITATGVKIPLG